jgi:hypothetical protein
MTSTLRNVRRSWLACVSCTPLLAMSANTFADEGGISYWLPGQAGSLYSVPGSPGLSLPAFYYHPDVDAGAGKTFTLGGKVALGLDSQANLLFIAPTYTFATPMLGGQGALTIGWAYGEEKVNVEATLTGPHGNVLQAKQSDSETMASDLYPTFAIKWNQGTSNWMAYLAGGVPIGSYQLGRLVNLGTNHWSVDGGGGYTYFNPKTGWEFSATGGFTYNFENSATDYQNGVDSHLDLAFSRFLNEAMHVGLVGYVYYQLTGDSGDGATLGDFKSRVNGIGPEFGMFLNPNKLYMNVKGYYEFSGENRADGWNAWLTISIPLGPPAGSH